MNYKRALLAFEFFMNHKESGDWFTLEEALNATGWKKSTFRTYHGKKWTPHIRRVGDTYKVVGFENFTAQDFIALHTQVHH